MAIPTTIEQSCSLYSITDNNILYWSDWIKHFIDFSVNVMGWEVECGPGTSYGAIFPYYNNRDWVSPTSQSAGWDCDWTQPNGIVQQYKDSTYGGYPLYTGWFYDYPIWNRFSYPNGIDESYGRFDVVIYMKESPNNGEKIGLRIKFPLCSVGYAIDYRSVGNGLFAVPGFSVYSNLKGNIQHQYSESTRSSSGDGWIDITLRQYLSVFSKADYSDFYVVLKSKSGTPSADNRESQLFDYDYQLDAIKYSEYNNNNNRVFKLHWKKYNRVNYHISKDGYTTYFYVWNDETGDMGMKVIITQLENGEWAVMIDRYAQRNDNTLCQQIGYTGTFNSPGVADGNFLARAPLRPFIGRNSLINRFAFTRMLMPYQLSLCKDLYYVSKRDVADIVESGQYVMVRDKNNEPHYFRVIPFGSYKKNEGNYSGSTKDNTTLLAFPVSDPEVSE
jgi:hypothetical protein